MKIDHDALQSIGRISIACFFVFHVFAIGVAGIANTISSPPAKQLRQHVYPKVQGYLRTIDQTAQNWGFFSFVPNAIIRFSFVTTTATGVQNEVEEYSIAQWPYIGKQVPFNFLRSLAAEEKRHALPLKRYVMHYCTIHDLHDTQLTLLKKYAYLPKEQTMFNFDWRTWQPEWETVEVTTVHCQ